MIKFDYKLKDFIKKEENTTLYLFGDLMSTDCEFHFIKDGVSQTYIPSGIYYGEKDYLLEYRVCSIRPRYKIVKDRIIPILIVYLSEE